MNASYQQSSVPTHSEQYHPPSSIKSGLSTAVDVVAGEGACVVEEGEAGVGEGEIAAVSSTPSFASVQSQVELQVAQQLARRAA